MVKKTKPTSLNQLSKSNVESEDVKGVLEEIQHASDRTAAIVLASWVERSLEQSIVLTLLRQDQPTVEKLIGRGGALSSFFAKTHLGFAQGLYDAATRDNLDIIRNIRNAFAHSALQLTFQTPQVAAEVNKLQVRTTKAEMPAGLEKLSKERKRYTLVCTMFVTVGRLRAAGMGMDI